MGLDYEMYDYEEEEHKKEDKTLIQLFLLELRSIQNQLRLLSHSKENLHDVLARLDNALCYGESRFYLS